MPDFEKIHRELQLHLASDQLKPVLKATFDRQDRIRWQIVKVSLGVAIFLIALSWIVGG